MCEALLIESQMNQNICDILHANTIDMLVYVYTIITNKLWLNVVPCILMNFFI